MSGLPWDDPNSDPLGDIRAMVAASHRSAGQQPVFSFGSRVQAILLERFGREACDAAAAEYGATIAWDEQ